MKKIWIPILAVLSALGLVVAFSFFFARNVEKVEVTYVVSSKTVKTKRVIKGNQLGYTYVFEGRDHQTYADVWKDVDGNVVDKTTIINKNTGLIGEPLSCILTSTTEEDEYTFINGLNHVCNDGIVVIASFYQDKELCIGDNVIKDNDDIKDIYLPTTVNQIGNNNFVNCSNLINIYYAGTEEEWNAIPNSSVLSESITVTFETPFRL